MPGYVALLIFQSPCFHLQASLGKVQTTLSSYLAEDDGLANGDAAINVAQGLVLVLPAPTQHVILSDVVQGQLLFS